MKLHDIVYKVTVTPNPRDFTEIGFDFYLGKKQLGFAHLLYYKVEGEDDYLNWEQFYPTYHAPELTGGNGIGTLTHLIILYHLQSLITSNGEDPWISHHSVRHISHQGRNHLAKLGLLNHGYVMQLLLSDYINKVQEYARTLPTDVDAIAQAITNIG